MNLKKKSDLIYTWQEEGDEGYFRFLLCKASKTNREEHGLKWILNPSLVTSHKALVKSYGVDNFLFIAELHKAMVILFFRFLFTSCRCCSFFGKIWITSLIFLKATYLLCKIMNLLFLILFQILLCSIFYARMKGNVSTDLQS